MKTISLGKYKLATVLPALLALSACGGGGGGTAATSTSTSVVSTGVMTKGSVIVNGVRFEDSTANIVLDDTPKQAAALKDGMVVKVKGRINADGISGIADNIEADNEVRGVVQVISAITPGYIEVLGQRAYVDDQTLYDGVTSITGLTVGVSLVEVYGLRDANGNLRASRIELLTPGLPDEVRGIVSAKTTTTFNLGTLVVSYSMNTVMDPPNATFVNGDLVEVHLVNATNTTATATRIELEDLEDAMFAPGAGVLLEVEGFVSGYTPGAKTFTVAGRNVQIDSATRFLGGAEVDLMNNIKVEVEGVLSGTTLVASKIVFKHDRLRLQGVVSAVDGVARTLTVFGKPLRVTDLSQLQTIPAGGGTSASLADIAIDERVEMRGFFDKSGAIVVDRLEETNDNADIIQARVTAKNEVAGTLGIFGIIAQTGPLTIYQGINDAVIGVSAFFAAITPVSITPPQNPGTLVKLKGTFSAGVLMVGEAELQDD